VALGSEGLRDQACPVSGQAQLCHRAARSARRCGALLPPDLGELADEVSERLSGAEAALVMFAAHNGCRLSTQCSVELAKSRPQGTLDRARCVVPKAVRPNWDFRSTIDNYPPQSFKLRPREGIARHRVPLVYQAQAKRQLKQARAWAGVGLVEEWPSQLVRPPP